MCKYYGYTRVSTETQAEKGGGLDVQRQAIERYAADHDITLADIYTDAGISGTTESRPALDRLLLETIAAGDTIIVHNTSRLWRDIFAQATIMKTVMNARAHIISIDEPEFDVYKYMTDPANFMISGMMTMLDQWERMTVARKLARGRTAKASHGAKPAGACPYGYQYAPDKKSVVIVPDEAEVVKRMYSGILKGMTVNQIANELNADGLKTRHGKAWSRGAIYKILSNEFYAGVLRHAGQPIKGTHKVIVNKITFGKVQAALQRSHDAWAARHSKTGVTDNGENE